MPEAFIDISKHDGLYHVRILTRAATIGEVELMATDVMRFLSAGKTTHVRAKPSATSQVDYETGEVRHQGHARFSFKDEPGISSVVLPYIEPNAWLME